MRANSHDGNTQYKGCSVIEVMAPRLSGSQVQPNHVKLLEKVWQQAAEAAWNFKDSLPVALRCVNTFKGVGDSHLAELILDKTNMFEIVTWLMQANPTNATAQHQLLPLMSVLNAAGTKMTWKLQSTGTMDYLFQALADSQTRSDANVEKHMDILAILGGQVSNPMGAKAVAAHSGGPLVLNMMKTHFEPYYGKLPNSLTMKFYALEITKGLLQNNQQVGVLRKQGLPQAIVDAMQAESDSRATQDVGCQNIAYLAGYNGTKSALVSAGAVETIATALQKFSLKDNEPFEGGQTMGDRFQIYPWCTAALEGLSSAWGARVKMVNVGVLKLLENVQPEWKATVDGLKKSLAETHRLLEAH